MCGEVSLVEQDTIKFVSVAYLELIIEYERFLYPNSMQIFMADAAIFKKKKDALENIKTMPSKVAQNVFFCFFAILPTGQRQAQILNSVA